MIPMLEDDALIQRVLQIYQKLGLQSDIAYDPDDVYAVMKKDKKVQGDFITVVKVKEAGHARLEKIPTPDLHQYLKSINPI